MMEFQNFSSVGPLAIDKYTRHSRVEVITEDMLVYGTLRVGNGNYNNFHLSVFTDYIETYAVQGFTLASKGLTAYFTGDPDDLLIVDLLRRNGKIERHDWITLYSGIKTLEAGYMPQILPFYEDSELHYATLWGTAQERGIEESAKVSCYNTQKRHTLENVPFKILTINWKEDAEAE